MLRIKIRALLPEYGMRCIVEGGAQNMKCDVLDAKKEETTPVFVMRYPNRV